MTTANPTRRRRRRSKAAVLAAKTITDVKREKLKFLRTVSGILSDALGFNVKVSLGKAAGVALSPDMRRASRMTKAQARRQMADAMNAPVVPGASKVFNDDIGF